MQLFLTWRFHRTVPWLLYLPPLCNASIAPSALSVSVDGLREACRLADAHIEGAARLCGLDVARLSNATVLRHSTASGRRSLHLFPVRIRPLPIPARLVLPGFDGGHARGAPRAALPRERGGGESTAAAGLTASVRGAASIAPLVRIAFLLCRVPSSIIAG